MGGNADLPSKPRHRPGYLISGATGSLSASVLRTNARAVKPPVAPRGTRAPPLDKGLLVDVGPDGRTERSHQLDGAGDVGLAFAEDAVGDHLAAR